jgi:carbon monoxide dehydrogenase subunit G
MNVNINKTRFSKNQQEAFDFLSDMENYRELMPEDTKSFDVHDSGKGFAVQIGSLPKVGMKLKESNEPNRLVFESPSPNFEYYLTIQIDPVDDESSDVSLDFEGKFNMMIEMMAKGPLTNFINTIAEKLGEVK